MLEPDENEDMDILVIPETKAIKTGVEGDGSCFLHAVILSMSPVEYKQIPRDERTEFIAHIRGLLADNITFDEWIRTETSVIGLVESTDRLLNSLKHGKKFKDPYMAELIKNSPGYKPPGDIDRFMERIHLRITDIPFFKESLAEFIISREVADAIVDYLVEMLFKKFIEKIRDVGEFIGDAEFSIISKKLGVFVIFVNDKGTLYKYGATREYFDSAQHVVLINYIGAHYESIGIVVEDNKVRRLFEKTDPLIAPLIDKVLTI